MVFAQIANGIIKNTILLNDISILNLFLNDPTTGQPYDFVLQIDFLYPRPAVGWTFDGISFQSPDDGVEEDTINGSICLLFSKNAPAMTPGTYLNSGSVSSSNSGQSVLGRNFIIGMSVTNTNTVISNPMIFQLQERTDVNTFVDIEGASISIPVGSYSTNITFSPFISVEESAEISAYLQSGDSPGNPVLQIHLGY